MFIECLVRTYFTGTLWVFAYSLISQARKLKFRACVLVQLASLGCEIGSLWLLRPPFAQTARPRVVEHYLPTAKFLASGHFPGPCQGNSWGLHSCQILCIQTQAGAPDFSLNFPVGRTDRQPEVLDSDCLQIWELVFRLLCQLPSSPICLFSCILFSHSGHR